MQRCLVSLLNGQGTTIVMRKKKNRHKESPQELDEACASQTKEVWTYFSITKSIPNNQGKKLQSSTEEQMKRKKWRPYSE